MERIVLKRATMENTIDEICPKIIIKLEKEREEARNCHLLLSKNRIFKVSHKLDSLHVNMNLTSYNCRMWDLTEISCCDVISCCTWLKKDAKTYVNPYFKMELVFESL